MSLSRIEEAIEAYARGEFVIIVDDEGRENEGDLAMAAEFVTPEAINFCAKEGRGLICCPLAREIIEHFAIPMMVPPEDNKSGFGTGFTLSVEAAHGVTTGISAADRAHTVQTLINPRSLAEDIVMPGHMFPLCARDGGVLERDGQTEASVDMSVLAGLRPGAIICEIMNDDGSMARMPDLEVFAHKHQLHIISVEQIQQYRRSLNASAAE